jgi:GntR family phosphonate transport system transcriptional regulator
LYDLGVASDAHFGGAGSGEGGEDEVDGVRTERDGKEVPLYQGVAEDLEGAILRGDYGPGERLPTERALVAKYGVNRQTVRQALERLQYDGLVYRVERRGTFVRPGRIDYLTMEKGSFTASISRLGLKPSHEIFHVRRIRAYGRIPAEMGVPDGDPLVAFDRVSYAGEIPLIYSTKHFRERLFPGLHALLGDSPSLRVLIEGHYGIELYRARTSYGLEAADPAASRYLGVPVGTALLRSDILHVLEDGTPAGWNDAYARGDALRMRIEFREVKEERD